MIGVLFFSCFRGQILKTSLTHFEVMTRIQQIRLPSLNNPDLAYETGVHIGDGCMQVNESKHDFRFSIWGSSEELDYYEYTLKPVLAQLYGLKNVKVKKVSTEPTIYLRVCSKELVIFKHEKLGLPIGKKSQIFFANIREGIAKTFERMHFRHCGY
jgi:hypothetical protein